MARFKMVQLGVRQFGVVDQDAPNAEWDTDYGLIVFTGDDKDPRQGSKEAHRKARDLNDEHEAANPVVERPPDEIPPGANSPGATVEPPVPPATPGEDGPHAEPIVPPMPPEQASV